MSQAATITVVHGDLKIHLMKDKTPVGGKVGFYAHGMGDGGSKWAAGIVRAALIRGKGRWTDNGYLSRIIFCEMVKDDVMGTTGFGIHLNCGADDSWVEVEVHVPNQTVTVDDGEPVSFDKFVKLRG